MLSPTQTQGGGVTVLLPIGSVTWDVLSILKLNFTVHKEIGPPQLCGVQELPWVPKAASRGEPGLYSPSLFPSGLPWYSKAHPLPALGSRHRSGTEGYSHDGIPGTLR